MGKLYEKYWPEVRPFAGIIGAGLLVLATHVLEEAVSGMLGAPITQWIHEHPFVIILAFGWVTLLIAYYKELRKLRREKEQIREQLNGEIQKLKAKKAKNTDGPVSLNNAVWYIMKETDFGKRRTYLNVLDELKRLAKGATIEITGREKHPLMPHVADYCATVPAEILRSCVYEKHGELKTLALVEVIPKKEGKKRFSEMLGELSPRVYYHPTVLMSEIKRHFV